VSSHLKVGFLPVPSRATPLFLFFLTPEGDSYPVLVKRGPLVTSRFLGPPPLPLSSDWHATSLIFFFSFPAFGREGKGTVPALKEGDEIWSPVGGLSFTGFRTKSSGPFPHLFQHFKAIYDGSFSPRGFLYLLTPFPGCPINSICCA